MRRFLQSATCLAMLLSFNGHALANEAQPELTIQPDAPSTYIVKKGDTLWDISAMYLDSPWLWPRLWQVNSDIENPHLIYPGDKLSLVWYNGQPRLVRKSVVKLSPKVRVSEKRAVPVVNEGLVLPYIQSDRIIPTEDLDQAEKVVGTSDQRKFLTGEDRVFISSEFHEHQHWGIYRPVTEYTREDNDQSVTVLRFVAKGELVEGGEDYIGLKIQEQTQEILVNDIVLPFDYDEDGDVLTTTFHPQPAPAGASANILGNIDGQRFSVRNQVVVINRGANDAVIQGSVFRLFEEGGKVFKNGEKFTYNDTSADQTIKLPSKDVGELMVIRPYQHFSLALVTRSYQPVNTDIMAFSPVASDAAVAPVQAPTESEEASEDVLATEESGDSTQ